MYAIDLLNQFNDYNGTVLSNGKMYVYYLGRVALANVYHDVDGQVPIPNPVELDNLGMAQVYVSNAHDYTIVLTDVYGNEMFSRDLFVNGSAEGGGNARLYEGIDPIVVNNEQNIISAKLANLGVESPLYFIEDTEESTVIGVSGDFASVSASANLTAYKEDDVTWISGKDWSTDITNASANAYEQATANDYRPLFEGDNGKISAIDNSAILIPDVVDYSAGANINISNHVVSLDTAVELTDILRDRGAILDPSGLYVSNLQQTTYTEIGKDHVFSTDGSASIGWQLGNKAISIGDNSGNGDYRNLILGLDDVLLEERHQEPTPDKVYSLTGACESALSAINMINSGDNQAYSAGANINITDHVISGKDWSTEIGDKLDATAFSTVSGDFLTSLPANLVYTGDITGKADTTALTAYLTTADSAQFYTNDNPSGFITGVDLSNYATTADVTAKLDTTAFSDVSGSFLTAHQSLDGLMSADLLEFSGAVITAYSGCKFAGEISGDAGDAEVNALVHSNSGTWDSVTSKLDDSAFSDVSGSFITAIPDLYVYKSATKLEIGSDNTANYDGAIAIGRYNSAIENSIAMGGWNKAREYSVAMGVANTAISDSIAVGEYCSAGNNAQAFGYYVTSQSGMAIGNANLTTSAAFVIGDGNGIFGQYSDLFRIDPDAKAYIQKATTGMSGYDITPNSNGQYWQTWQLNNSRGITRVEFPRNNTAAAAGGNLLVSAMQPNMTYTTGLIALSSDGSILFNPDDYGTNIGQVFFTKRSNTYNIKDPDQANATGYITAVFKSMVRMATLDDIPSGSELPESASEALNVVTSNSASWDEISAYIASSASYITSLPADLVYTGDITGKLDTTAFSTVSGDFYTTANESGFITGVDLSNYVVKSAFDELKSSYDALSSLFSTYSGQWLLA